MEREVRSEAWEVLLAGSSQRPATATATFRSLALAPLGGQLRASVLTSYILHLLPEQFRLHLGRELMGCLTVGGSPSNMPPTSWQAKL